MENEQVQIYRKSNGKIVVEGSILLTDEEGNSIPHGKKISLCGCGKSQKLPLCDGSHKN